MQHSRRASWLPLHAAVLLLIAGCTTGRPAAPVPVEQAAAGSAAAAPAASSLPPVVATLVEGARKESTLKGTWGGGLLGGASGFSEVVAQMNQKYGLNVQAQFTPGRDMQGVMALITQEQAAGQPASTDVYFGNAPAILDAEQSQALRPMDWAAILERMPPSEPGFDPVAPGGIAVAYGTIIVGVEYNTNLVRGDDVPRHLEDPLAPKWKGKIASTPYAAGMREFAMPDMLGRDAMLDYTRRLSQQVGGLIRCGEDDRVGSGEFAMLVFSCGGQQATKLRELGAPVGYTVVQEASVFHMMYGGVPKNSSAPNAAALLIAYLETPEGQAELWKLDAVDYHLYPEANTKKLADEVRAAHGKLAIDSPQWLASATGFAETQRELEGILQQSRP
ncbi:MAG TPA: extracellular solute-binding protein [Chloroflexota bacterium]|nr:extracellular solute-binding protein [Chloroflexota bacterium]